MLQNIRDNIQGTMAKVIIAIIIVPFAIFGVESLVGGSSDVSVVEINGEKITETELQRAVDLQKRQMLAMMGDNIQPELLDDGKLRGPALQDLITQRLLLQTAQDLKLRTPVSLVDQTILAMPSFQEEGRFSPELYQALLRNQGYTPLLFKQLLQQEMLGNQLQMAFMGSEFVTEAELRQVAALLQQRRSFNYLTVPAAPLAKQVKIDDAAVQQYYESHAASFMDAERVRLEYIELRTEDYAKPVDEAALKAEYERVVAEFRSDAERRAAHILIEINDQRDDAQARALAESLAAQLGQGESFEALARQHSDDAGSKNSGGDLGFTSGDAFPPAFEQALAGLGVGEVSAPVKTDAGYHLIKLVEQQVSTPPAFEAMREELTARLQQNSARVALVGKVEHLRDLVFNSDGLKGAAEDLDLEVRQSEWIDRNTGDPLFSNPRLVAAAFGEEVLKERNNSDVMELSPDHYVVLRIAEHQPAAPKPLDSVREAIVAALVRQQANAEAVRLASTLQEGVEGADELQQRAKAAGYAVQSVEHASRTQPGVAPEVLEAAFAMPRPAAGATGLRQISLDNGDVVVVQLQGVDDGQHEIENPAQREALMAQLRQGSGAAAFTAFMEQARAGAEIKQL